MKLILNDCLLALKEMPDNSVDSVVTDPPYGLSFMGKAWDYDVPSIDIWREVLRVLKPGGHLLSFAGSRTYHRMAVNIEDAGFEIRDMIEWVYGCLSEDTEILTLNGWERYHKAIKESPVICYNMDKDSFEIHQPERSFIYENKHPAYRIKSDFTDQIVSRNHRCIVERGGRKVFAYAETLERQESVPFLESLHDLPETIPYLHEGTSITKQDLLQRVRLQEYQQKQEGESNPSGAMRGEGVDNLPCMWEGRLEVPKNVKEGGNTHLQQTVQRGFEGGGMEETRSQREGELDEGVRAKVSRAYDGGEQPSLEGRGDVLQKEGQLYGSEVCTMPRTVPTDVEERRLYYGTSADRGATLGENVEADRSSTSYRSRSDQQRSCESYVVSEQQCSQEVRSYGKTRTTLATVEEVEYVGNMWCVQVPTGAFVARRNGQIFITGNSGFPKSLNIGKAYDKKMGNERSIVGHSPYEGRRPNKFGGKENGDICYGDYKAQPEMLVDKGTSDWEGWGTALKPAHEPIVMARKPLIGTVVENVIKYGTGGINIDGCRVESNEETRRAKGGWQDNGYVGGEYDNEKYDAFKSRENNGRFPANLIHDGSDEVLAVFPQTGGGKYKAPNARKRNNGLGLGTTDERMGTSNAPDQYGDSGSASRYFYAAKASKRERGQGNNHPTVKPISLMKYLVRLVTPPNGTVLDPFMGSGTTGIAAKREGFSFIGIEREPEYMEIAKARIDSA